ncbi:MAG: MoaD/ThiS family protein [Chloroflexi bacterium]|nr:MoaD/ThiS family protein [Chloroflexota bacterium]
MAYQRVKQWPNSALWTNRQGNCFTNLAYDLWRRNRPNGNQNNMAQKMTVSIKFLGMQRVVTKKDFINIPLRKEMRVSDVLELVRNLYPDLHLDAGVIFPTVNQEKASLDKLLRANDIISFLPPISGG